MDQFVTGAGYFLDDCGEIVQFRTIEAAVNHLVLTLGFEPYEATRYCNRLRAAAASRNKATSRVLN